MALKTVRIRDLVEGLYDGPHATPPPAEEGPVFLGINNISDDGRLLLDDVRHIDEADYNAWTRRVVPQPGDIVFTYEATLNRYAVIPVGFRGCLGRRLALLRVDERRANARYLHRAFFSASWRATIKANTLIGATVDRIPLSKFLDFPITVHARAEQDRIADVLSAYDDLIENNTRRIRILEEMARALYREWFVEMRFPGYREAQWGESEFGPIPRGWSVLALEDVCTRITDGAHASPASVEVGMPMASIKDMREWGLDLRGARKISEDNYADLVRNGCRPARGDVLLAKDGNTYLKFIFAHEEDVDVVLLSSIAILRPNARVEPRFLAAALREPGTLARLKNLVSGAAIPRVVLKDFRRFRVVVPPIELQREWDACGGEASRMCWHLSRVNERLAATRDLLLPRLLSGEIELPA